MAVTFSRSVQVLIHEFQRRGLNPEVVATSGGEPPRAVQIRVADALMVHWDADSRSVWAEGPWPEVQRLENFIRRRFNGGRLRRLRKPATAVRALALVLLVLLVFGVFVPLLRKRPPMLSPVTQPASTTDAPAKGTTEAAASTETPAESPVDDAATDAKKSRPR